MVYFGLASDLFRVSLGVISGGLVYGVFRGYIEGWFRGYLRLV